MDWSEGLLERVRVGIQEDGKTYADVAQEVGDMVGEYIHPEQLRGAYRRWLARSAAGTIRAAQVPARSNVTRRPQRPVAATRGLSKNGTYKFGALGDTHLGSNYENLDALHDAYRIFQEEGVVAAFHTGNYIEGEARFNKDDIHVHGLDNQARYFVEQYPVASFPTYYISGDDHEGWYGQREGIDVGERAEDLARRAGRNDLIYLGYMEYTFPLFDWNESELIRILHPGGGSSQAVSWTSQKIASSIEDEDWKPRILLCGHYHKAEFLPSYKGMTILQTGTFQEQSPFMRKKNLRADLGAWIITVKVEDGKITRIGGDYLSYKAQPWQYR